MKLWKKGLAALTAGLLCLGSVGLSGVELPASADVPYFYDGTYGDLYYDVIDAVEIRITGCEKEVTAVEIPAKIAGKPVTSVGRSDFPTGDAQALLKSLNHVVMRLPDEVIVYPGHGPSTTIGEERETNPFVER